MKVTVRSFTGIRPAISQDLLKPGEAVVAENAILQGGDLEPLKDASTVTSLTNTAGVIKTIYRFGQGTPSDSQYWFQSEGDTNFVRGMIDGDLEERTYMTGHGTNAWPAKTRSVPGGSSGAATSATPYPANFIPMGLYKPVSAPSPAVTGTATDATSTAEDVAYIVTLVTDWGEEGPPSAASGIVTWRAGQSITVTLPTSGVPSYPNNVTKSGNVYTGKRLYRSATGTSGSARWLLVNKSSDIPLATATYSDSATTSTLGEVMPSLGWVEPPDGMRGLTAMSNGILAGYVDNTLCFSEPFTPYAWPVRYQQTVDSKINGIAAFGQSLLVSTTRGLHIYSGADPASITGEKLPDPQISISRRAMVPMIGGIIFPTPDGLGFVGPGGFRMLSDGAFTRREWVPYTTNPSTMHAYEIDGRYVLFYDNGTSKGALVFKFGEDVSVSTTTLYATAGFRDPGQDALFLCVNTGVGTNEVQKWDAGALLPITWTSSVFRMPAAVNIGAARVEAVGSINFELLADGTSVAGPYAITSSMPFKLPGGIRSMRYQFRLTGTSTVKAVELGDTVKAIISE